MLQESTPYVEIIIARGVGDNGVDGGAASMSVVQYAGDVGVAVGVTIWK